MKRAKFLRVVCFFLLLCLLGLPLNGQAAVALPQSSAQEGLWLPLSQFGYPGPLRLSGQFGERYLYLPIPPGMQTETMRFTLRTSADVQSGFLEIYNRERVLQAFPLESSQQTVEFSLNDAQVENGYLVFT